MKVLVAGIRTIRAGAILIPSIKDVSHEINYLLVVWDVSSSIMILWNEILIKMASASWLIVRREKRSQ